MPQSPARRTASLSLLSWMKPLSLQPRMPLPALGVLLPKHINSIRPATNPIRVHCNKGTLETTQEANFGDTPVYFNARGIANVLSRYQLGQKFQVTYDSTNRGGVFKVFTTEGVSEFRPTSKGLHALNLQENSDAAFLLVNDANLSFGDSPVKTV